MGPQRVDGGSALGPVDAPAVHPAAGPDVLGAADQRHEVVDLVLAVQADGAHSLAAAVRVGALAGEAVAAWNKFRSLIIKSLLFQIVHGLTILPGEDVVPAAPRVVGSTPAAASTAAAAITTVTVAEAAVAGRAATVAAAAAEEAAEEVVELRLGECHRHRQHHKEDQVGVLHGWQHLKEIELCACSPHFRSPSQS